MTARTLPFVASARMLGAGLALLATGQPARSQIADIERSCGPQIFVQSTTAEACHAVAMQQAKGECLIPPRGVHRRCDEIGAPLKKWTPILSLIDAQRLKSQVEGGDQGLLSIGFDKLKPGEFPAHLVFGHPDGSERCLGAAVGPNAFITAAHCVVDGSQQLAYGQATAGGTSPGAKVTCTTFSKSDHVDLAMCKTAATLGAKPYESLDLNSTPSIGQKLVAIGVVGTLTTNLGKWTGMVSREPAAGETVLSIQLDPKGGAATPLFTNGDSGSPYVTVSSPRALVALHVKDSKGGVYVTELALARVSKLITDWALSRDVTLCLSEQSTEDAARLGCNR